MTTPAIGRGALPGWWKIISFHLEFQDSDQRLNLFGVDPLGHVVIVDDRIVSIITSGDRAGKDDASLFETMMAYSGAYRVEDEVKLVIKVDAAWHPAWVGTEQVRVSGNHDLAWELRIVFKERLFPFELGDGRLNGSIRIRSAGNDCVFAWRGFPIERE